MNMFERKNNRNIINQSKVLVVLNMKLSADDEVVY